MNKGGFSWKRAVGVTKAKRRVARATGIPLTKSGRQRKVGKAVTGGGCLMPAVLLVSILAAACAAGGSGGTASPADATAAESIAAREPQTVSGKGIGNSAPMRLEGSYEVSWAAQADDAAVGCSNGGVLERVDGSPVSNPVLVTGMIADGAPHSGKAYVYTLASAEYFVHAISSCSWSFTFTAQ